MKSNDQGGVWLTLSGLAAPQLTRPAEGTCARATVAPGVVLGGGGAPLFLGARWDPCSVGEVGVGRLRACRPEQDVGSCYHGVFMHDLFSLTTVILLN